MMRTLRMDNLRALACAAALLVSGGAAAQVDCSSLAPALQARCEGVNRMHAICAGLEGAERRTCERENRIVPIVEDCGRAPPAARAMCEAHNRAARKAELCNGQVGAAFAACQRANGINPPTVRQQ